ncbi:MAG: hypothetical protein ABID38_06930 [Candidatus Diapherotrites archaeon]
MKRLTIALFLFLISAGVMALSISAPSSVPSNAAWSFSVELNPTDSFNSTEVQIDGSGLLTVHSNGNIVPDSQNGGFVIKAFVIDNSPSSTSGLILYVSHMGLNSGSHTVVARENTGEESSASVDSLGAADLSAIEAKVNQAVIDKENIDAKILGLTADARAFNQMIKTNEESIAGLRSQLDNFGSSIISLEGSLQSQGNLSDETKASLQQLRNEYDSFIAFLQEKEIAEMAEPESGELIPVSGMVGLGMFVLDTIWLPVIALFAFIVIVLVAFYVKKALTKDGSSPYFEADSDDGVSFDKGISPEDREESGKKGKWSSE